MREKETRKRYEVYSGCGETAKLIAQTTSMGRAVICVRRYLKSGKHDGSDLEIWVDFIASDLGQRCWAPEAKFVVNPDGTYFRDG